MRCLVFGGTGMLGQAVVAEARSRGWDALGLSRAQADVLDRGRPGPPARGAGPGGVPHLRTVPRPRPARPGAGRSRRNRALPQPGARLLVRFRRRDRPPVVRSGRGRARHHGRVSPACPAPGVLGAGRDALRAVRRPAGGGLGMGTGRDAGASAASAAGAGIAKGEKRMRALITGITGFAGSHLAEYILAEQPGVEVFGTFRWRSRMDNVEHLDGRIKLVEADLRDYTSMHQALATSRPDVVFHLAAQR